MVTIITVGFGFGCGVATVTDGMSIGCVAITFCSGGNKFIVNVLSSNYVYQVLIIAVFNGFTKVCKILPRLQTILAHNYSSSGSPSVSATKASITNGSYQEEEEAVL